MTEFQSLCKIFPDTFANIDTTDSTPKALFQMDFCSITEIAGVATLRSNRLATSHLIM
jgi:hypothetical protein